MSRRRWRRQLACAFAALVAVATVVAQPATAPDASPPVVLMILRGASYATLQALLRSGQLPADGGFARVIRAGGLMPLQPAEPAVTAVATASLLTGQRPGQHGVVGNSFVRRDQALDGVTSGFASPLPESVGAVAARAGKRVASLHVLLPLAQTVTAPNVQLRAGPAGPPNAAPAPFAERLTSTLGRWPGMPDFAALRAGTIDEDTYLSQATAWSGYVRAAVVLAARDRAFDLILWDEPVVDMLAHQFTTAAGAGHVTTGYRLADTHLREVLDAVGPDAHVIVASPYGMGAVHTSLSVSAPLVAAGLRVGSDASASVRTVSSGPIAHIYVGREADDGRAARERTLERARRALAEFTDPSTGRPVLERVLVRDQLADAGLAHPSSGDIVVSARGGYMLFDSLTEVRRAPEFPGDHGHRPTAATRGLFMARPAAGGRINRPRHVLDVAPIVKRLLGL